MKLASLKIEQERWGPDKGKYIAQIEYEGVTGSVKLNLPNEVSARLLEHIGEDLEHFSAQAARDVEKAIRQSVADARATPLLSRL